MNFSLSRRVQMGLALLGINVCLGLGGLVAKASLPLPVRTPFPNAILLTKGVRLAGPGQMTVTRQYVAPASHRAVVEWYHGKDSLMPLPAVMWSGCSTHYFHRRQTVVPFLRDAFIEEEVTVCPTSHGVTIASVTALDLQGIAP
jgi:hypothetical protein